MCECQDMSMDMKTPRNVYLTAFYKRSFAYHTVKNRMPVIITQLIDSLSRNKNGIIAEFGEESANDLKLVISELSKFKYEVQTNKPLTKLTGNEPDINVYNDYIDKQATEDGQITHFNTIWLLTECYMYRRIKQAFSLTQTLSGFDYFMSSKKEQFEKFQAPMATLAKYLLNIQLDTCDRKQELLKMFKVDLWGNKCDLSISLGKVDGPLHNPAELDNYIIVNDFEKLYDILTSAVASNDSLDIVLDNAGYELFTDLCLMHLFFLLSMVRNVTFHVKSIPWFISDVMEHDFHWVIEQLCVSEEPNLKELGQQFKGHVSSGAWKAVPDPFWTYPFEFKYMKETAPKLYKDLGKSSLVIFKGDLNYRKLFCEKNWDPTTPPIQALEGFLPNRICTIRTVKADIVVGLRPGLAEKLEKKDPKWMENGDFGLIQFINKQVKGQ